MNKEKKETSNSKEATSYMVYIFLTLLFVIWSLWQGCRNNEDLQREEGISQYVNSAILSSLNDTNNNALEEIIELDREGMFPEIIDKLILLQFVKMPDGELTPINHETLVIKGVKLFYKYPPQTKREALHMAFLLQEYSEITQDKEKATQYQKRSNKIICKVKPQFCGVFENLEEQAKLAMLEMKPSEIVSKIEERIHESNPSELDSYVEELMEEALHKNSPESFQELFSTLAIRKMKIPDAVYWKKYFLTMDFLYSEQKILLSTPIMKRVYFSDKGLESLKNNSNLVLTAE